MGLRRTSIGVVICFLWMAQADAQERLEFIPSPFGSLARTRLLLDAADLRVMLGLGYALLEGDRQGAARLTERQGVLEVRVYRRMVADSSAVDNSSAVKQREYRVEIGIISNPLTPKGYEFAIYSERPGRDFKQVVDSLKVFSGQAGKKDEAEYAQEAANPSGYNLYDLRHVGFEMHTLSHIEAHQALELLRALGYSTVRSIKPAPQEGGFPSQEDLKALAEKRLPIVVNIEGATRTSLGNQPTGQGYAQGTGQAGTGGGQAGSGRSSLDKTTAGEPQQRLMIIYDRNDPEGLQKLLNLLDDQIDVPAEQVVIEALILEVNASRLRDLGVEFQGQRRHEQGKFKRSDNGADVPFSLILSRKAFEDAGQFEAKLEALMETGEAEVLSSPSVLVLNDRQARIQIGQYVPATEAFQGYGTGPATGVKFQQTGITLNLRPRISREKEITMQVEVVVSAANQKTLVYQAAGQLVLAPTVDSREVESFVRVADNTPFIIGGLISTDRQAQQVGIPLVSQVPLLGRLFRREHVAHVRREVIVVITPHIVPQKEKTFGYLIPKDSPAFDRFNTRLFRNAYRVRDDDILDFKFVRESQVLKKLGAELKETIPGEEILVQRMLYEIVSKLNYDEEVDVDGIHFFEADPQQGEDRFRDRRLKGALDDSIRGRDNRVLLLSYDKGEQAPSDSALAKTHPDSLRLFNPPIASTTTRRVPPDSQGVLMKRENTPEKTVILFAGPSDVDHLRRVLVLKRLLELNFSREGGLPRTLQAFRPGLQLLFPSQEEMRARGHLIDLEIAQLFYQTRFYYSAFERKFNETVQGLLKAGP